MNGYEWIQIGVKAELCNGVRHPELNGSIVTISSEITEMSAANCDSPMLCVDIEEGHELAKDLGCLFIIAPIVNLKPFNPPNWEGIADGSVECKSVSSIIKEICPIGEDYE